MRDFRAEDCEIYRPYPDEIPWELIEAAAPDLAPQDIHRDFTRVAKYQGEIAGVYVFYRRTMLEYELLALSVAVPFRRRGLGRWLMGHAIGLAETKGGRELYIRAVTGKHARALFAGLGFKATGQGFRFEFIPE